INSRVDACSAAYIPNWLLDEQFQKRLQRNSSSLAKRLLKWQILPNIEDSLSRLGLLLSEFQENTIGKITLEQFKDWLKTDWKADLMPVHSILKCVADRFGIESCYHNVTSGLR